MSELQDINFLLPDYIILSEGEVLPGLANCLIGPEHDFENLVKFETVYIKNIMISISPNLEHRILEFANKYREKKYKINSSSDDYSKYNNVYIKFELINYILIIYIVLIISFSFSFLILSYIQLLYLHLSIHIQHNIF